MQTTEDHLPWHPETWHTIQRAVYDEALRVEIATKFLPIYEAMPEALTVTSDTTRTGDEQEFLYIDEAAVVPLNEIWVEFALTPQQVMNEADLRTARTLAIRATNFLALAEDTLIFQGQSVVDVDPLFTENRVGFRSGPAGTGLLNAPLEEEQIVTVEALEPGRAAFRERTVAAVTDGCARLKKGGHYGPYALVLHDLPYGDTFSPLPGTLIMAADRLKPLMTAGFFGTSTVPEEPALSGLLVSLHGNSMDLIVSKEPMATYLFDDREGLFRFRVAKRFALRLKDTTAVIKLVFTTA